MNITTIYELKEFAKGKIVSLPGWEDDKPFVARLTRPSLQIMAMNGQIPNTLLVAATKIFAGKQKAEEINITDATKVQMAIAKASLVEPTVEDIEATGLTLTDQQLIAIFNYSQMGMAGLERFRTKQADTQNTESEQIIPE